MRSALAPLGRLTRAAAEIERTGDRRRRSEPEADDEVGRLATTLNRMLAALERSRDGERRFLADASHELRTPLTALVGNVAYLAKHGASSELIAELDGPTRAGWHCSRTTSSPFHAKRPRRRRSRFIRLDELTRSFAGEGVDVRSEPVSVRGDPEALERALTNLIENAHRHGRGRITVEARPLDGRALLTVSDEGPGLSPEETQHAFERFWRGEAPGPGSGLGLAIVRATAERHGGRAYVEGSRFTIDLPAVRDLSEFGGRTNVEQPKKGSP